MFIQYHVMFQFQQKQIAIQLSGKNRVEIVIVGFLIVCLHIDNLIPRFGC